MSEELSSQIRELAQSLTVQYLYWVRTKERVLLLVSWGIPAITQGISSAAAERQREPRRGFRRGKARWLRHGAAGSGGTEVKPLFTGIWEGCQ